MAELEPDGRRARSRRCASSAPRRPELERFLRSAEPFARESRESIDDLGERRRRRAARRCASPREEVAELRRAVGRGAAPRQAAAPVPPDDRRPPPLDRGRPAGRPSSRRRRPTRPPTRTGQGFTGMEALLELHLLPDARHQRVRRVRPPAADRGLHRRARARPTRRTRRRSRSTQCASWLGPTQPGVLGQPDPTERAEAAGASAPRRASASRAPSAHRGAGEPDAPPAARASATSRKPQVVLPEDVQRAARPPRASRPGAERRAAGRRRSPAPRSRPSSSTTCSAP